MSKGSNRRPTDEQKVAENWARAFVTFPPYDATTMSPYCAGCCSWIGTPSKPGPQFCGAKDCQG